MSAAQYLAVSLGGALGAALRYGAVSFIQKLLGLHFPYGTLFVNVIGSGLIGVAAGLLMPRNDWNDFWRLFFIPGLLGGFTTFSAFSLETVGMIELGMWARAMINICGNLILCIFATGVGILLARQFLTVN